MNNADKPAFSRAGFELSNLADHQHFYGDDGLTKREYFAAMAMQGILSNPKVLENPIWADGDRAMDELTAACIEHADHLLKQLEK